MIQPLKNRARRTRAGEMLFDVAKYVLTIVVVGTAVNRESADPQKIAMGLLASALLAASGWFIIPEEAT